MRKREESGYEGENGGERRGDAKSKYPSHSPSANSL